jgi:hypothetical protein
MTYHDTVYTVAVEDEDLEALEKYAYLNLEDAMAKYKSLIDADDRCIVVNFTMTTEGFMDFVNSEFVKRVKKNKWRLRKTEGIGPELLKMLKTYEKEKDKNLGSQAMRLKNSWNDIRDVLPEIRDLISTANFRANREEWEAATSILGLASKRMRELWEYVCDYERDIK